MDNIELLKSLDGCKVEVKEDGVVIITPISKDAEFEPEDGYICIAGYACFGGSEWIYIHKTVIGDAIHYYASFYTKSNCGGEGEVKYKGYANVDVEYRRLATEAEKQILFDALAKDGKKWNTEKKCIEDVRWRAKRGSCMYYYVDTGGDLRAETDSNHSEDDMKYNCGNYFRTEEEAKQSAIYKAYLR